MKQLSIYLLFLFVAVKLLSVEYIESSNGLNYPELEGGNTEMEFADIDADGNIDILSIGDHGSPNINTDEHGVMVWFGDGNGNWAVYQNGDFGYGGIAVGDVNNDGFLDVGYAMHHNYSSTDFGDQLIEVALGDGTGMNWIPWDDGLATNGEDYGMFGTDFADVDNDGDLDIGSNSFGFGDGIHVYLNQNDGSWIQSFGFIGGNSDKDIKFGDINKDGNVDFVVKHEEGAVFFGDGTGNFVNAVGNLPSYSEYGTSIGDVDNDGGMDISFITGYIDAGVEVWTWDEDQEIWIDFSGNLPTTGCYETTQLYDMNVDGYVDVCAFGQGTFSLWLGDGTGNWTLDAQFNTPSPGWSKAFNVGGDIDHNGFPDIVLVSKETGYLEYQNFLHCYKETSIVDSLTITPMFPRGNEVFQQNSIQFIDWVSAVPEGESSLVKLDYSINGDNGPWTTISDSLPNNGRFQWAIPEIGSPNYCIRYTVWTSTDIKTATTPQYFAIIPYEIVYPATNVLAVVNEENTEVLITWNSPSPDERDLESYDVYRFLEINNAVPSYWDLICESSTDTSFIDTDWVLLEPDLYQYAIVAIYSNGLQAEAAFSNVVGNPPVLDPPTNLVVDGDTGLFTWDAPQSPNLTGYNVFLDDMNIILMSTPDLQCLLTDFEELVTGQNYTAGVSAVYDVGTSEIVTINFIYNGVVADNNLVFTSDLIGNYPNPFNPTTTISFSIVDYTMNTELVIYNLKGQMVKQLVSYQLSAGQHSVIWDGTDENSQPVSSGIYFYKLRNGNYTSTKKMILIK